MTHRNISRDFASACRALVWGICLLSGTSLAQNYPVKPIRIIVPNAAGGGADILARSIAQKLNERWGQPIIVDNRPGAGSVLGTELAAKATPDGYTVVVVATGHAVNPSLMKLPYDSVKDFVPITQLTASPNMLIVHPSLPARTLAELIALARRHPGAMNYSSAGNGTAGHLAAELFKMMAKVNVVHVPYKAAPQALSDVISGQIQMQFSNLMAALPHVKSGKLRGLAVTTLKRSPAIPELPTLDEAGLRGYRVDQTYGLLAPANTPSAIVEKLNTEVVSILRTPELSQRLSAEGAMLVANTPQEYREYLLSEMTKWARVIKEVGIRAD